MRILERSRELSQRAHAMIPGGAHTYSKGDDQFPSNAPSFIARGDGCITWDVDGNEYIDLGMGLRSVILGHAHEPVLEAVRAQLGFGSNFSRPAPIEVELADELLRAVPGYEMVKFAKNGSDVTSAAIRLARAYTGRDIVAYCLDHPFFSVQDWFIGTTAMPAGIPKSVTALTTGFRYNDLESLRVLFEKHPGKIACVIMEPMTVEEPAPGFLSGVRQLCQENGALLIFDEIITGFRWSIGGAQTHFGVKPDLSTFGKALGNGFSVAALMGPREVMERGGLSTKHERVFLLSATNGGETHALAAAKRTVEELIRLRTPAHLRRIGELFIERVNAAAARHGLTDKVRVSGSPCSPALQFSDPGLRGQLLKTLLMQEVIERGVLFPGYIALSQAHSQDHIEKVASVFDDAFGIIEKGLVAGDLEALVRGPLVKPVFRRFA